MVPACVGGIDVTGGGTSRLGCLRLVHRWLASGNGAVKGSGATGGCRGGGEGSAVGGGAATLGLIATDRWRNGIGDGACLDVNQL